MTIKGLSYAYFVRIRGDYSDPQVGTDEWP